MRNVSTVNRTENGAIRRGKKLYTVAIKVCVSVVLFALTLCLFSLYEDESKSVLNQVGTLLDADYEPATSDVAYAWSNPSGETGDKYVSEISSSEMMTTSNNAVLVPNSDMGSNWNYGGKTYSGSGHTLSNAGIVAETKNAVTASMLFYVDIYLDDVVRSAIKNGRISSCSVAMQIDEAGGAYWRNVGHFYGTFFLCSSASGEKTAGLDDMGTVDQKSVSIFDNKCGGGRVSKSSGTLSINLTEDTVKIRYGVYFKLEKDKSAFTADVYVPAPEVTKSFMTDNYKATTLTVDSALDNAKDADYCAIKAPDFTEFSTGTTYTVNYTESNPLVSNGKTISKVEAKANPGYYFCGWEITGTIGRYTGGKYAGQSIFSPTLDLGGGYALNGNVTAVAHFKKIIYQVQTGSEYSTEQTTTFTYLQEEDSKNPGYSTGIGVGQGPVVIAKNSACGVVGAVGNASYEFDVKPGSIANGTFTSGSKAYTLASTGTSSTGYENAPADAGSYKYTIGVFAKNSSVCLGYLEVAFTINPLNVDGAEIKTTIDTEFIYNGSAFTPVPDTVDIIAKNGKPYRLKVGVDYGDETKGVIRYNQNVNATDYQSGTCVRIGPSGNFSYNTMLEIGFTIKKRDLSDASVTVDSVMAAEIQERYNLYYTGYEQRPDVILTRVKIEGVKEAFNLYNESYGSNYKNYGYDEMPTDKAVTTFKIVNKDVAGGYENNINATTDNSKASFVIEIESGNFKGTKTIEFDIAPLALAEAPKKYSPNEQDNGNVYSGYTVSDQTEALTYSGGMQKLAFPYVILEVKGLQLWTPPTQGNTLYGYNSNGTVSYIVLRKDVTNCELTSSKGSDGFLYTTISVTVGGKTLTSTVKGTIINSGCVYSASTDDYTYGNNINVAYAGEEVVANATATVTLLEDCENITGSITTKFKINPMDLSAASAQTKIIDEIVETYTGLAITPNEKVKIHTFQSGTSNLKEGTDYTLEFSDNVNATKDARITVYGIGNYTGKFDNSADESKKFIIKAIDISNATIDSIKDADGNDFEYALGEQISPTPATVTVNVGETKYTLTLDVDYKVVAGSGENTNVGSQNYICIQFAGRDPDGADKGGVDISYGTLGNFYSSQKREVYFSIAPRDISKLADTEGAVLYASWDNYRELVTYDGSRCIDLPIIADKDAKEDNTLYILDSYNKGAKVKRLVYGNSASDANADYKHADSGYGENINAGVEAGEIIVEGVNNYTGTLSIHFRIYERDIGDESNQSYISVRDKASSSATVSGDGYSFTGVAVQPGVEFVTDAGLADKKEVTLALDKDYTIGYGENINVRSGGTIEIIGKGNYTGTYIHKFNIKPIDQTVSFTDPGETETSSIKAETIAYDKTGKIYANYEVARDVNNKVRVEAVTTATQPGARRVNFVIKDKDDKNTTFVSVKYESCEIIEINGAKYSKTVAILEFTGYGIAKVYAVQNDGSGKADGKVGDSEYTHLGNYNDFEATENEVYVFFSKMSDSTSATFPTELQKTYGNDNFSLEPGLNSYKKNANNTYKCKVANEAVLKCVSTSDNDPSRKFAIVGAGSTTITIYHDGFVDYANPENSYVAFSRDVTVNIAKRDLTISFERLSVEYGTDPTSLIVYTYKTSCTNDSYTGLVYGGREDKAEDIILGLSVGYSKEANANVGTYKLAVREGSATGCSLYNNYNIKYAEGELEVTKSLLTVSVTNTLRANQIRKSYGDKNPETYTISYGGFKYNETESVLHDDKNFIAPHIEYNNVNNVSAAGSYSVTLTGGEASNYYFEDVQVTCVVDATRVTIALEKKTAVYSGVSVVSNMPEITGVEGGTAPIGADDASKVAFVYYTNDGVSKVQGTPTIPGTYDVEVTFTAESGDNYSNTTQMIKGAIVIEKAEPTIEYPFRQYEVSGNALDESSIRATIRGAGDHGKAPAHTDAQYLFAESGTVDEDMDVEDAKEYFSSDRPKEVGKYDVIVIYTATLTDYYKSCSKRFNAQIEISKGLAIIELKEDVEEGIVREYTGEAVGISLIDNFKDIVYKDKSGYEHVLDKNDASIEYYVNGEFRADAPTDVGTYDIRVIYKPSEDNDVSETTKLFTKVITITPYDLYVQKSISVSLQGTVLSYKLATYDGEGHGLGDDEIRVKMTDIDESRSDAAATLAKLKEDLTITYMCNNVVYDIPKNVGTYDVIIKYDPAGASNYTATGTVRVSGIIRIEAAMVDISAPVKEADYTGLGVSLTATAQGVSVNGVTETPTGTLEYEYSEAGMNDWQTEEPVKAGKYDVRVTYRAATKDNYADQSSEIFTGAIVINTVKPVIVINNVKFAADDESKAASYTISGTQYDVDGPMQEVAQNLSSISVYYGTRRTSASGVYYEWDAAVPATAGKYSVRVEFEPVNESNYLGATLTVYDCLTISNVVPKFDLQNKTVTYNGSKQAIGEARVYLGSVTYVRYDNAEATDTNAYYGTVSYDYRKAGSSVWSATAPSEAGTYDVRVKYTENTVNDIFSSTSEEFAGALVINQLVITVAPVYGQGKVYDGTSFTNKDVAYLYSYVSADGNVEYVFSVITDNATGDRIDASVATYVTPDGDVYTIYTDTKSEFLAWREYVEVAVELLEGEFSVGENKFTVDYGKLGQTGEVIVTYGDTAYRIDLDNGFARKLVVDAGDILTVENVMGNFLGIADAYGRVTVKKLDANKKTVEINGTTYKIDIVNGTATANGETFKLSQNALALTLTTKDGKTIIYLDPSKCVGVSESGFCYFKTDSACYLVDLVENTAREVYNISLKSAQVAYDGEKYEFSPDSIESEYYYHAYMGNVTLDTRKVFVDLNARTARFSLNLTVEAYGENLFRIVEEDLVFGAGDLVPVKYDENANIKDLYKLGSYDFYIDLAKSIAYRAENRGVLDTTNDALSRTVGGKSVAVEFDKRELTYNVLHRVRNNGVYTYVKADTTKLYSKYYLVSAPELIAGNSWKGNLTVDALKAGEYGITAGKLSISSNYKMNLAAGDLKYFIDRAGITVTFEGLEGENAVYNGVEKVITYSFDGFIGNENENVLSVKATYEGDRRAVTDAGYRMEITINAVNYYLIGGTSEYYYILPAEMEKITFNPQTVVYDGQNHRLELADLPVGATVKYDGSDAVPSYVEPGTYTVGAVVSKANYVDQTVELKLIIRKSVLSVTPRAATSDLKYGDALPELIIDTDLGKAVLDAGQELLPDVTTYSWTFVPNDEKFYDRYESEDGKEIKGTIELNVAKAAADIKINANLTQVVSNPKALLAYVNGDSQSDNVTIEYMSADGVRYASLPTKAGQYTVIVTYKGNEYYSETVYKTTLTIKDETDLTWLIYVGAALLTLTLASTVFFLFRKRSV